MVAGWIGIGLAFCAEPPERAAPTLVRPGPNAKTVEFVRWILLACLAVGRDLHDPDCFDAILHGAAGGRGQDPRNAIQAEAGGCGQPVVAGARGGFHGRRRSLERGPELRVPSSSFGRDGGRADSGAGQCGGRHLVPGIGDVGEPAPAGGASVELNSSDPSKARVPARVIVDGNALAATFVVSTMQSPEAASVRISATARENDCAGTLTVGPPGPPSPLVSFAVNPPTITGGSTVEGILTLGAAAPAPQGKLVPNLVGTTRRWFPFRAPSPCRPAPARRASRSRTAWATSTRSVGMTATLEGVAWSATLTVRHGSGLAPLTRRPHYARRGSPGAGGIHRVRLVLCGGAASYTIQVDDAGTFQGPLFADRTVPDTRLGLTDLPARPSGGASAPTTITAARGTWSEPRPLR